MALLDLPQYRFAGTPAEIGRQHGTTLGAPIRAFVAERMRAAKVYLHERGIRDQRRFVALGRECLQKLKEWDRAGWDEHIATAAGAAVDADELYTAANMTDIRDILALAGKRADAEGCSAALIPPRLAADGQVIAAQTWDLNPGDVDFVVAIRRDLAGGPSWWSVGCVGCPTLIALNDRGVAVGTTNIKTSDARVGVPYLGVLHRAIRASTRAEAAQVIETAPRAAAHTYWVADATGASDFECSATAAHRRDLADHPLVRTNHCLDERTRAIEAEPPSSSSQARVARLATLVGKGRQDVASLRKAFADRSDGVDSLSRWAEDAQGTATDACIVCLPAKREMHACRGPSDRGAWVRLGF
ncbi:MAG TPA: C45 family peptidase [Planctomycetota bacterium]|nr:C45 family peptidase [Planctomycetota bacterium]